MVVLKEGEGGDDVLGGATLAGEMEGGRQGGLSGNGENGGDEDGERQMAEDMMLLRTSDQAV